MYLISFEITGTDILLLPFGSVLRHQVWFSHLSNCITIGGVPSDSYCIYRYCWRAHVLTGMATGYWTQNFLFVYDVCIPTICRTEDGIAVSAIQIHYI